MSRTVYLNGQFVPEAEAKLSIYDLSVMQAAAAFEMTRSFNGEHFKLTQHLNRLRDSCAALKIPMPIECDPDYRRLEDLCRDVSGRNDHGPGEEHRLLIVVSPGCAPMYKNLDGVIPHPFLYLADFPLRYTVQGFSRYFTEGVHAVTSKVQQLPDTCVPSAAKHRSRLHFHLAQQQAPAGTWPILLDAGMIREAPGANVLWVSGGQVYTCEPGALPGISLQTVKALTGATACPMAARDVPFIDELWLTCTPACMLPVVSLDGKLIGDGTIGPVYKETVAKWKDLVQCDFEQQMLDWDAQKVWTPDAQRLVTN